MGVLMAGMGALCAAWGGHDTVAWIAALYRGDGVVRTESVILGLPFLGSSVCLIGIAFLFPSLPTMQPTKATDGVVIAVLGAMVAGLALLPLGGLAIDAAMAGKGYRACDVRSHGRVTTVAWAGPGVVCAPP